MMNVKRPGISRIDLLIGAVVVAAICAGVAALFLDKPPKLGKPWRYDAAGLDQFNPKLILHDEVGQIETGLRNAKSLAVGPDGRIYVAGDKQVKVLGQNNAPLGQIDLSAAPRCLAVADDGALYVGLGDHVEIFDSAGRRKAVWKPASDKSVLTSIAIAGENVFVADAGRRIVLRYDTSGNLIGQIGGFVVPSPYFDLAVGADNLLWVTNPGKLRVESYTFDGQSAGFWGRFGRDIEGFGGCCNPANFAIGPDGQFVTAEKGLVRVKVFDSRGRFVGVVAGPAAFKNDPETEYSEGGPDLAVDSQGRVFVLDTHTNTVRIFVRRRQQPTAGERQDG